MPQSANLAFAASALMGVAAASLAPIIGPVWDKVTARQIADLSPRLQELRLDQTDLPKWLRWWGLAMLGVFVLFAWLEMIPVGLTAVYLVYISPRMLLARKVRRRSYQLRDQMVGACVGLSNAARAGLNLAQGFESIAPELPEPIGYEFRRIVHDYHAGRPIAEVVTQAKDRLQLDGFTIFAAAILAAIERGGPITDALDRISRSLQETQRLERKLEADTESGRLVALVLGAVPFVFLAMFSLMEPEGVSYIFSTTLGQVIFVIVVVLVYVSVRWCNRIVSIEV